MGSDWRNIFLHWVKEVSGESGLALGFSFNKVSERSKFGDKYKTIPFAFVLPLVNHTFLKVLFYLFAKLIVMKLLVEG